MATAALHPTPAHKPAESFSSIPQASSSPQDVPRGSVTSTLNFYDPPSDGSKPHNYVDAPTDGRPQRNFGSAAIDVTLNDLRGHESEFTLDNNAFATLSAGPSNERDFRDDASIKRNFYPEVEQLLMANLAGVHKVVLFDHTVRRTDPAHNRAPVTRVHIDQTPQSAAQRVRVHCPDDAEALLRGRYRIVNVWRPLNGPVVSFPLAVCDSQTVRDEDLVPVEHRYPDRTGETAAVRHHEDQKWYYWSGMTNEERLLLKCYDSDEKVGKWGRVPHTAFVDPRTREDWPGRESIEVRALIFG